jgi:hypothetical protein
MRIGSIALIVSGIVGLKLVDYYRARYTVVPHRIRAPRRTVMFESRSRVVLLTFLTVVGAAASAQQPAPAPVTPPQGQAQPVTPPEIVAAEAEAATRRYEAGIDLHALVAQVAASTGKEFLIDPRVRARVYAVPRIENPTYSDLLSVLRLNGYIGVEIGGKVSILPDANARAMPTRLLQRDDESVADDGGGHARDHGSRQQCG